MIKQQQPQLEAEGRVHCLDDVRLANLGWFQFGYDPATKEHKVIALWSKRIKAGPSIRFEFLCEVLTVGRQNNSWRKIDDVPPASPTNFTSSAYANGSIYWLNRGLGFKKDHEPCIVEFNFGSEKFRTIQLPSFIIEDVRYPYKTALMELDGRLALLPMKIKSCHGSSDTNFTSLKRCILCTDDDDDDDDDQDAMSSSSSDSGSSVGNYYWMEETFSLPPFDWKPGIPEFIRPIPGTNLLIIRHSSDPSFYYYNWKRKSFSCSKCEMIRIHAFLIPPCDMIGKYSPIRFGFYAFAENLSPVN
ncbi:hypothetical protein C5167_035689 [Papaver somniferum]|uniref:uncharacterized protein LOC113336926 n=1 Tax=Papaver somniferum TaxID=3469 RepID=UPI000E6FE8D9|nr:uncharacterized protein LOC113336926 [Papaver somniferum]XP_026438426.1 uncharacterized protein LOC113336926 [Papaver somniferum]XP_026438427.1 uncharacterized protein LOC113336926 [Papaver somniferum]RZC89694.1 hypothetical protein C5167_035689 [Papaver somniferum]